MTSILSRRNRAPKPRSASWDVDSLTTAPFAWQKRLYWKPVLDRGLALLFLIPGLPLIALLALWIRLSSPGPGIYRQRRVGRQGRVFTMYKLRSMKSDAEVATGPVWAQGANDPRVTPLGATLRRLHLDELPQLFNVIRGEMSLVGPRPERPEIATALAEQIPGYLERLQVLPGVTGLAQINLAPDTDVDSVRRKLILDREYIAGLDDRGPALDLRILACTALQLCGFGRGVAVQLFGLDRSVSRPCHAADRGVSAGESLTVSACDQVNAEIVS